MIYTTAMIMDTLKDYGSPKTKLQRMVNEGKYYYITKGLYETDRNVSPHLLAASIYGPSYISFDYALSFYGMIPEAVYTVTCATYEKKKKKSYTNAFGTYTYRDVPSRAFPYGLVLKNEGDYWYRIATPEKALCDKLYTMKPVNNVKELTEMIFDDLRIDNEDLKKLDPDIISDYCDLYHSTNICKLAILLRRIHNE